MSKAEKLKKKAAEFEAKRQTDKAISAYLELFREWEADPAEDVDVALFNRVGDMLLRAGNVGDAMTVWETAVDHYAEGGFHNNAIALCNKILRNSPGRSSVYYKLGKISAQKGFRGDAKKNYLEYADRMQKAGQIDEAFRALKEFADLSPEDSDIRQMLADQLTKLGRSDEAVEQLQILYERYESTGDSAAAAAAVTRMRAIDPAVEPKRSGPRRESRPAGLVFLNVDDAPVLNARKSVATPPPPPAPKPRATSSNSSGKYATDAKTKTATEGLPLIDLGDDPPTEPETPPPVEIEPEPVIPEPMLAIPAVEEVPTPIVEERVAIIEEIAEPTIEPLVLDQPPSVEYEEAPSLIQDDVAPIVIDDIVPLVKDDALPLITDDTLPLITDDTSPLIADDPVPPIEIDVAPIVETDDVSEPQEDALPFINVDSPTVDIVEPTVDVVEPTADIVEPTVEVVEEEPQAAPPPEPPPLAFQDISFGASFGTGDDQNAATTQPLSDLETNALDIPPGVEARVSASLSLPEDLTFGSADIEPFSSATGDPQSLVEDGAPVEFGTSTAAMHSQDASIEFDPFDSLDPVEPIAPDFVVPSLDTPDSVAVSDAVADIDQMITAPPPGAMSEEEAPAPREAIQRKSMRPTMSTLALSVDSLRERVRADVTNWHLRREFAEALLEDGDREGGLDELETAMVGYERAKDYESARSLAEEIIRLQPLSVRHHQKRVEYSYRMNDRVRLIDAYLDLADALFQEGEAEKSKVVYERVLDLAPDDVRAIAAMAAINPPAPAPEPEPEPEPESAPEPAIAQARSDESSDEPSGDVDTSTLITDADLEDPPEEPRKDTPVRPSLETATDDSFRDSLTTPGLPAEAVPEPTPTPAPPVAPLEEKRQFADSFADTYKPRMTPYVVDPIKQRVTTSVPKIPEKKPAAASSEFVDLEDWLKEDEAPKSTRMVIPEQAPTGDETADFNDMLRKFKQGVAKNVEEEDHESHYDLGVAFKEMGLVEEAIAEFQKALRSPVHRVRTYEALGQCFLDKSQEQVAITILQRALNEPGAGDDKLIGVLYLLGLSSETLGQPREAVKYYQRVFAVDINFRDVRKRMREIEQAAR